MSFPLTSLTLPKMRLRSIPGRRDHHGKVTEPFFNICLEERHKTFCTDHLRILAPKVASNCLTLIVAVKESLAVLAKHYLCIKFEIIKKKNNKKQSEC